MPNLKHLLDDLKEIGVDPEEIRLPGPLFDDLVDQAETVSDEDQEG
ncbi:hypothetical protein ACFLU9_02455 [Chloroflexota bacterium]